jgi:hypothetical protein
VLTLSLPGLREILFELGRIPKALLQAQEVVGYAEAPSNGVPCYPFSKIPIIGLPAFG